jgi:hypothetical protein
VSRLVYIGDHCVEFSFGGHAFLAKLLEAANDYERVAVECGWEGTAPSHRLPGVDYRRCRFRFDRLQGTRFGRMHARWLQAALPWRARHLRRVAGLRSDDLVLTVAHEFIWMPALAAAQQANATSVVFVHDEWVKLYSDRFGGDIRAGEVFRNALARATRVLAVSEGMQERLNKRYGIASEVFLPPRRRDAVRPAFAVRPAGRPFRFAYCGQLWNSYWQALRVLAEVGQKHGWQLDIYTNEHGRRVAGRDHANVRVHDFLPEERLVHHLAAEADALVVALDFSDAGGPTMETMFSSKMAEYTATGLPVVIMAPPYANMARWGKAQGCFVVIDRLDRDHVDRELSALAGAPERGRALGHAAAELGDKLFSPERAVERLVQESGR